ncbi:antibiotic biosynthesis monooxygenase [Siminovitchia acidinfaciens]|uniref:Antibiotic biosynthesis monooxygenase n=1 Tax=Siminovitchia acidinfaciens TaxID=2321395 RepID=A0A429Y1X9_9BACI|nr:antibiotic biosynthesis monooxygenase [Siminovitchia acidinfaciens]RST75176.1 antibiotic biosynthesis monooxygenase [Siminovitchia acidinfaciens]
MYTYITTGTYFFLKKIEEKHPDEDMLLMQNVETALIWHETNGPTLFQSPRKYEVIHSSGQLEKNGFVACNHIPVREEGRPVFEYQFAERMKKVESFPGFIAFRLLRPLSNDTYVVMTMWEDEKAYNDWKQSPSFAESYSKAIHSAENNNVFSGQSYVSVFVLDDEKSDDNE